MDNKHTCDFLALINLYKITKNNKRSNNYRQNNRNNNRGVDIEL
jgi:hypothetical protein